MEARRRETLQQLQVASKDSRREEESLKELSKKGKTASLGDQSFEEALYGLTQALRDFGKSLSLTNDLCQRQVVPVIYHDLLKQSISIPYYTAPQVLILS